MADEREAHGAAKVPAFSEFLEARDSNYKAEPDRSDLYKFGFVATRDLPSSAGSRIAELIRNYWTSYTIGGYSILVHPDEEVTPLTEANFSVLIIGRLAFDGGGDPSARIQLCLKQRPLDALLEAMDDATGRFAIVLSDGADVWVFSDPFGSRSVFYATEEWLDGFSSHPGLLASFLGLDHDPDTLTYIQSEYYQKRVVKYLPGIITAYGGSIVGLSPNNYLRTGEKAQTRYWPNSQLQHVDVEQAAEAVALSIATLGKSLAARNLIPVLGITGGLDTRCVLAVLLSEGIKPEGVTWTGRYMTSQAEPAITKKVAEVAGIDHQTVFIDPAERRPHLFMGGMGKAVRLMLGPSRSPIGAKLTLKMKEAYPDGGKRCFLRGYGGEIIRGFYQKTPTPIARVNAEQFSRAYGTLAGSPFTRAAFDHMISVGNFDARIEDYGYDANDFFYWEHRMGVWGASMLSEMDPAMYSMVGLNSRRAYNLSFGVPLQQRLSKEVMRRIIASRWPDLAAIEHL